MKTHPKRMHIGYWSDCCPIPAPSRKIYDMIESSNICKKELKMQENSKKEKKKKLTFGNKVD